MRTSAAAAASSARARDAIGRGMGRGMCSRGEVSMWTKGGISIFVMSLSAIAGFWTQHKVIERYMGSTDDYYDAATRVRRIQEREIEELNERLEAEAAAARGRARRK